MSKSLRPRRRLILITAAFLACGSANSLLAESGGQRADWPVYGGNSAGQRYSPLTRITPSNVKGLTQAWRVETGPGALQVSPIVVNGILYACGPDQSVLALDAATGRQLWRFSSGVPGFQPVRGVTYWADGQDRRLFASSSYFLYALDAATGEPIPTFGTGGRIDLREALGRDPRSLAVFMTSPGIVYRDLLITGFRAGESRGAAPGAVRAYDVRTGKLRWIFNTIPRTGEPGAATWPADAAKSAGGANNWAGMALDQERGIVYVPTGSAVPDFYGAARHGDNLYANSLLALDAATGRHLWHFQAVHHDIWDRDLPAPPSLLTVVRGGKRIDAVAQASKQGFLYVLDRVTGQPVFPIEEKPFRASKVPDEQAAQTQPVPLLPKPFARQVLTEDMLTRRTPEAHAAALKRFREVVGASPYTPFSVDRKTVIFPGFDGGAEWGGAAVDPRKGVLYINSQDVPWLGGLQRNDRSARASPGKMVYDEQCVACHGPERNGNPPDFPGLLGLNARLPRAQAATLILNGKGRMPGFPQLTDAQRNAILDFLYQAPTSEHEAAAPTSLPAGMIAEFRALGSSDEHEAYRFSGYEKFRDPEGYPAVVPPWGTLNAIDLNTGAYLWTIPLGEYPELVAAGLGTTGSENYGGPLLTASRLLFIGATIYDRKFRAFDADNGRLLWQTSLPYSGVATPITYAVNGRQFVVIAASGGRDPKGPQGSAYVAFALSQ